MVYVLFHTHGFGHQIEIFRTKKGLNKFRREILKDYENEYEQPILDAEDLCVLSDGECNLETKTTILKE